MQRDERYTQDEFLYDNVLKKKKKRRIKLWHDELMSTDLYVIKIPKKKYLHEYSSNNI